MPRKLRVLVEDGIYYVLLSSNDGGHALFLDVSDYSRFRALLRSAARRFGLCIIAFSLTPTKVHLGVKLSDANLPEFVRWITWRHASRMNRKLSRRGSLFQQRYMSVQIDAPWKIAELVDDIHHAPVVEKLVGAARAYRWSSCASYTGRPGRSWLATDVALGRPGRSWLATDLVLGRPEFRGDNPKRRFELWSEIRQRTLGAAPQLPPQRTRHRDGPALLADLVQQFSSQLGIPASKILARSRDSRLTQVRAYIAYRASCDGVQQKDVAAFFGRSQATITLAAQRVRAALETNTSREASSADSGYLRELDDRLRCAEQPERGS